MATVKYIANVTDTFQIGGSGRQGEPGKEDIPSTVETLVLQRGESIKLNADQARVLLESGAVSKDVDE